MPLVQYANEMPGRGIAPADLHVRARVADRARRVRDAEAAVAHEVLAVVAGEHEPERAVDRHLQEVVGKHAAHVGLRVVQHVGVPEAAGIVHDRLVEEREIGRAHDRAAAGHAGGAHLGPVEPT